MFFSGLLLYGTWIIIEYLMKSLMALPSEIAAAIIATMVTTLGSVGTIMLGKYRERKLEIEKELREKKIPMYDSMIDFFLNKVFFSETRITEEEMKLYFRDITQKLIIWGSDEVISKWSSYRIHLVENADNQDPEQLKSSLLELEGLFRAIRKDTGHDNKNLKQGDILRMFINDFKI